MRIELDAMSSHLETKNTELMGKLAALESIMAHAQMEGTSSSAESPGLAGLEGLKATVTVMEGQFRITLLRADAIDTSQENLQRKTIDFSRDFESVKASMAVEMEQTRAFITEGFAALQNSAAAAQPAPADPRSVDLFTVHGSA